MMSALFREVAAAGWWLFLSVCIWSLVLVAVICAVSALGDYWNECRSPTTPTNPTKK